MRYILKISDNKDDWYMEWSTIIDAPVTDGMSLEDFKSYYKDEYPDSSRLEERLERVEQKGVSALHTSVESIFGYNRAGDDETHLDKQGLLDKYCK